jgi:hypothetical protein
MLACSSGTTVLTLETDGLLRVQVAEECERRNVIESHIGMVSSWRTLSTFVKDAIART